MKKLKNFEDYIQNVDEGFDIDNVTGNVRKFFTGHKDREEKNVAKQQILDDIDAAISRLIDDGMPVDVAESRKNDLIKHAADDNWKGKIAIRTSRASGKTFVVYDEGRTGLHALGTSAAGSVKGNL